MIRLKDATFEEAVSALVSTGLNMKEVEEEIKYCCKEGCGTTFEIGKEICRVDVLYNGGRRSDCNFWGMIQTAIYLILAEQHKSKVRIHKESEG